MVQARTMLNKRTARCDPHFVSKFLGNPVEADRRVVGRREHCLPGLDSRLGKGNCHCGRRKTQRFQEESSLYKVRPDWSVILRHGRMQVS